MYIPFWWRLIWTNYQNCPISLYLLAKCKKQHLETINHYNDTEWEQEYVSLLFYLEFFLLGIYIYMSDSNSLLQCISILDKEDIQLLIELYILYSMSSVSKISAIKEGWPYIRQSAYFRRLNLCGYGLAGWAVLGVSSHTLERHDVGSHSNQHGDREALAHRFIS